MRMIDLIEKKREGYPLTEEEIRFFVDGVTKESIPDYQISALLMAIYFQGMNEEETALLTSCMANSGETVDLRPIPGKKVDKHSTGGVGDKISLIVGPLVASIGVPVAKMSGRGLGHTGGTLDKLESIPGFRISLSREEFIQTVKEVGLSIVGQTGNLVPADKKLYALRDVTATVESIPLIASSIMSKKLASGADAILLDVKVGSGAFMKKEEDAHRLAEWMVKIGNHLGKKTVAVLTNMDQPLGFEVGNGNEIKEVIQVLKGESIPDLREISLTLASHMAVLGEAFTDLKQARLAVEKSLDTGEALEYFRRFVEAQGGDPSMIEDPEKLPTASYHTEVFAERNGYITKINAEKVGLTAMRLGAGREKKEDQIDHAAGVTLRKKIGDQVAMGEPLGILHSNQKPDRETLALFQSSFQIEEKSPEPSPFVYGVIE
ncbi:MAG: pyrimidine-nucleoside phosphorylase [Thermicanus sp.]|nr:pyrimidine-nucleoside phosphorylase [Thermicanus sp.]